MWVSHGSVAPSSVLTVFVCVFVCERVVDVCHSAVVVSVNPYKRLDILGQQIIAKYKVRVLCSILSAATTVYSPI